MGRFVNFSMKIKGLSDQKQGGTLVFKFERYLR